MVLLLQYDHVPRMYTGYLWFSVVSISQDPKFRISKHFFLNQVPSKYSRYSEVCEGQYELACGNKLERTQNTFPKKMAHVLTYIM